MHLFSCIEGLLSKRSGSGISMLSWFISCSAERTCFSGEFSSPSALFLWESLRQLLTACLFSGKASVLSWLIGTSSWPSTRRDLQTKKGSTYDNQRHHSH